MLSIGWKKTIVVLILSTSVIFVKAQQVVLLEEAIAAGLHKNYDILLSKNELSAASTNREFVYGNYLPNINATVGLTQTTSAQRQSFESRDPVSGSGIRTDNISAAINLNWTLFDGLKMFILRDKAQQQLLLSDINLKNQVVNTVADIISAYYVVVRQKQQMKAIEEQMSISEERVKLADRKLSVGLGTKPELLQARVDLNAQKASHMQQRTIMSQSKEQLNQLTGMQLPSIYEVTDSIPLNTTIKLDDIHNQIERHNPTLLQAAKSREIAGLTLKEMQAARWPSISFVSAYNFTRNENHNNINPFAPLFNRNQGYNFGLAATIPLLNNLNVNRNIRQARISIQNQDIALERQKSLVNIWVKVAYYNYTFQVSALELEEENIELAKENVFIALERFKLGVSTFLELREAQKSLEDAYDRLIAARYNTKLAETELIRLRGEIVQ